MDNIHQLPIDMYMRDLYTLKKSNLLIEKINTFSFNTHKIFNLILWEFQRQEAPTHHIQMPVHKMVELVGKKEVYRTKLFYQKIAKRLVQKTLDLIDPQEDAVDVTNLISRFTLEKGMIDIRVTDEFLELAGIHKSAAKAREAKKHLKGAVQTEFEDSLKKNFAKDFQTTGTDKKGIAKYGYTKLNLCLVNSLKSKHSIMLYEFLLMKLHFHTFKKHQRDSLELPVDLVILRKILCHHQKSYEDFDLFHRKILKPALNEINQKTDLIVDFQLQKSFNKVNAILFSMRKKKEFILQIEGSSAIVMPYAPHQETNTPTALDAKAGPKIYTHDAPPPQMRTPFQAPSPVGLEKNNHTAISQMPRVHTPSAVTSALNTPGMLSKEVKDMILDIKNDPHQQALVQEAKIKQKKTRERHHLRMQEITQAKKNGERYTGEHDTQDYFQPVGGIMGGFLDDLILKMQQNMNDALQKANQFDGSEEIRDMIPSLDAYKIPPSNHSNHSHTINSNHQGLIQEPPSTFSYTPENLHADSQALNMPNHQGNSMGKKNKKAFEQAKIEKSKAKSKHHAGYKSNFKEQDRPPDASINYVPAHVEQSLRRLSEKERRLYDLYQARKQRIAHGEAHVLPENFWALSKFDLLTYVHDPDELYQQVLYKILGEKKACLAHMMDPKSIYHVRPGSYSHAYHEYKKDHPDGGLSPEITDRASMPYFSIGALAARLDKNSIEVRARRLSDEIFEGLSTFEKSFVHTSLAKSYDVTDFQRILSVARNSYDIHWHELNVSAYPCPEKRFLITYNIIKDQYLNKSRHECKLLFVKIFNDTSVPELDDPIKNSSAPLFSDAYAAVDRVFGRFSTLEETALHGLRFSENCLLREGKISYFMQAVQKEWHVVHKIWHQLSKELAKSDVPNAQNIYLEQTCLYFETAKGHDMNSDHDFHDAFLDDKNVYLAFEHYDKRAFFEKNLMHTLRAAVKSVGLNIAPRLAI